MQNIEWPTSHTNSQPPAPPSISASQHLSKQTRWCEHLLSQMSCAVVLRPATTLGFVRLDSISTAGWCLRADPHMPRACAGCATAGQRGPDVDRCGGTRARRRVRDCGASSSRRVRLAHERARTHACVAAVVAAAAARACGADSGGGGSGRCVRARACVCVCVLSCGYVCVCSHALSVPASCPCTGIAPGRFPNPARLTRL